MPIYEYQCTACGHKLEALQRFSDNPLTDCPQCHQQTLGKLVSAAGFQLKGTGWYKTDYSAKGKPKPSQETEGSGSDSTSGTGSKPTDAKTDAKTDDGKSKVSTASKEASASSSGSANTSGKGQKPPSQSGVEK